MFHHSKTKTVLIAGCGRLGSRLAGALSEQGYDVTIIDPDPDSFRKLPAAYTGFQMIGDATDVDVLEAAGIKRADIFLAAANRDNINSMVAQIASVIYGVREVFIRLYDTDKKRLLTGLNIQAIFPADLSLAEFERLSSIQVVDDPE